MASLDSLSQLLVASGLIDESALASLENGFAGDSPNEFAAYLVANETITRWQADQLLNGRWKGFFLDEYKILNHIGDDNNGCRYLAQNLNTGESVVLAVGSKSKAPMRDGERQYVVEKPIQ